MRQGTSTKIPAPASNPTAIVPGPNGTPVSIPIPLTAREVDALRERVNELSSELNAANSRRNALAAQLRIGQTGVDKAGLESRITQLDGRILGIEADIAALGRAISAAPNGLSQSTAGSAGRPFGQPNANQVTAISIIAILAIGLPLSIGIMRLALRRASRPAPPQMPKEVVDRLERMEQGIDAMAVELERVGEGQRFVTQLMSDRAKRAALPEGVPRT